MDGGGFATATEDDEAENGAAFVVGDASFCASVDP